MRSKPPPEASVVIVTWNGRDHLESALPAVVGQKGVRHEVILVDNGSTDGTVEWVHAKFPSVRVIGLAHNTGFAGGNNRGFEAAIASLIATINNDAIPEPYWLSQLVTAARVHPKVGMFASQMVHAHNPKVVNSAGISIDPLGISWDRSAGKTIGGDTNGRVFGASAGAALYRRELLKVLGGFDERFFAYLEDVDLAWRARWLGGEAWYVSAARVSHAHSSTWQEDSPLKTFHLGRNKVWLIAKNYPLGPLLCVLPLIVAYDIASLPITIMRQHSLAAVRGRLAGIAGLRQAWASRGPILGAKQHGVPTTWSDVRKAMDPIVSPFTIWRRQRQLRGSLRPGKFGQHRN